jgi:EpsD family peptidyl-prolyl cis-trans isomerase
MHSRPVLALVAALSTLTSGCGDKATGQTVAVVNGEEISAAELNAELQTANIPESADKKTVLPQLLQRIIDRRVMAQRAEEQGVTKSPEYLTRQRRMNEELLISMMSRRQADTMKVPTPQEIDAFITANPRMFGQRAILLLDQLEFDVPRDRAVLDRLKDDHSLEAIATTITSAGIRSQRGKSRVDTRTIPAEVLQQIEALPSGEPFIIPTSGKLVANVVTNREPVASTPDESRAFAAEALRRQKINDSLKNQLKQLRSQAKIEYQPGYEPKKEAPTPAKAKS